MDKTYQPVRFSEKLSRITELWQPRVVAELNDYQFKVVRIEGDFIWHDHPETDEAFIVLSGQLRIDMRDGAVTIGPGAETAARSYSRDLRDYAPARSMPSRAILRSSSIGVRPPARS